MTYLEPESIRDLLSRLEREWAEPRQTVHHGKPTALPLSVRFERADEPPAVSIAAPPDVMEFWSLFKSARLFEDHRFSQWGLVLVPPERAQVLTHQLRRDRARDVLPGDLVIGEFLGDSDLLVVRTDREAADYGSVLVVLPLDRRQDWFRVGASLTDFLRTYAAADGAKFWETPRSAQA